MHESSGLEALVPVPVNKAVATTGASSGAQKLRPVGASIANDTHLGRKNLHSPASAMFDGTYQGGAAVDVFSAGGSNPTSNWKVSGQVQRVYDKSVKGYVFQCEGGAVAKMQLPKDERRLLGLMQPYLVLQLTVRDEAVRPRALHLRHHQGPSARPLLDELPRAVRTPLHTRLPLSSLQRDVWLNLTFDLVELVGTNFPGATFARLESLSLGSSCKVRRIFTLRAPPLEGATGPLGAADSLLPPMPSDAPGGGGGGGGGIFGDVERDGSGSPPPLPSPLPRGLELPPGTISLTQVYRIAHILRAAAQVAAQVAARAVPVAARAVPVAARAVNARWSMVVQQRASAPAPARWWLRLRVGLRLPSPCGAPTPPPWSPAFGSGLLSQSAASAAAASAASAAAAAANAACLAAGAARGPRRAARLTELLPPPLRNVGEVGIGSNGRLPNPGASPSASPLHATARAPRSCRRRPRRQRHHRPARFRARCSRSPADRPRGGLRGRGRRWQPQRAADGLAAPALRAGAAHRACLARELRRRGGCGRHPAVTRPGRG